MLKIKDLSVAVEGKEILHDINMTIETGETLPIPEPGIASLVALGLTALGAGGRRKRAPAPS
jgi:Fe-S cluster assembly ATPase SufC